VWHDSSIPVARAAAFARVLFHSSGADLVYCGAGGADLAYKGVDVVIKVPHI